MMDIIERNVIESCETGKRTERNVIQVGEQRGIRNLVEIIDRNVIENCETGKRTERNVIQVGEQRGTRNTM
jgi:hypothetical protein